MTYRDPFVRIRHDYKGVYIATPTPRSTRILARAMDVRSLEQQLQKKQLANKPIAVQYLEPKRAICAYGISLFD